MIRAFQWDLARQVERLDWLLAQLPKYAAWGYQELHLHLEDAVDYPSLPGVARRDAYSWFQLKRLVTAATAVGINVVPIVNLLGHTQYLIKHPEYRDLNELRAPDGSPLSEGQICPSHPRTRSIARALIADVAPLCTAGKVHVGLDESFHLGRHPDSARTIAEIGLARYFAAYVTDLHGIAAEHDLRTAIWGDMLVLLPDAIAHLPRGLIVYDWYYHAFARHPRFEARNFAEYDLVPALRTQGIDYWGCPMNGAFRYEPLPAFGDRLANAMSWWRRCRKTGAGGFLVTGWEPNRLAMETTVLIDAAIAGLWLDDGAHDQVSLLRRGFERTYGPRQAADRARLMLACDERAFSGYARWETHQRWDSAQGREGPAKYAADERFFRRVAARNLPPVISASLRWRHYLAIRDQLIRQHAGWVQRGRRLLQRNRVTELKRLITRAELNLEQFQGEIQRARQAADEMWLSTRRATQTNPNQRILRSDTERSRKLQQWWSRLNRKPALVESCSPVFGRWQLIALVHATHPNLQAVAIQTQDGQGQWHDCHTRYLIEFRSHAARPRANVRHWISIPLDTPDIPVRFGARGLGQFSLSDVHLTNGIEEKRPANGRSLRRSHIPMGVPNDNVDVLNVDRSTNRSVWRPVWINPTKS